MANTNDERILQLREQIAIKKEKLGKVGKFLPATNLVLELDGVNTNLNVLNKEQLIHLMVKLNTLLMSAKELKVADKYIISGYNVEDWIGDIQLKLDFLSKKDEERALKQMEAKLEGMLSEQKKVELELDEIANLLND
jgi:hypothetical protein